MNKKAFTLVELIVVITILAVLATIAFVSFQGYGVSSRDSVRLSDIKSMEKVINLYRLTNSKYPTPNDFTGITYSGSTVWTQGVFGTNAYTSNTSLSNIPSDPITGLPYAYSVTNTKQEYQMAAVLEGEVSLLNLQIHAGDQITNAYIRGDYNGKFIKVSANSTNYLLGVPSILASDITSVDMMDIVNNNRLVYKGYNNLPASYSGSIYNNNGGFNFTPNQIILFEGDISDLENNPSERIDFFDNLQTNYSTTVISGEPGISDLLGIDSGSSVASNNYVATILNNSLHTQIETINQPIVLSDIYHDTFTVLEDKVTNGDINGMGRLHKIFHFNNRLYFQVDDVINGNSLWISDGTDAGTMYLTTISGNLDEMIMYNNEIYAFTALSAEGSGPWHGDSFIIKTDGTPGGTSVITQLNNEPSIVHQVVLQNNKIFIVVSNTLFSSDGTSAGTIELGSVSGNVPLVKYNNYIYYSHGGQNINAGLWRTDGTLPGTESIQPFFNRLGALFKFNNSLYFTTFFGDPGFFKSDGTTLGTNDISGGQWLVTEKIISIGNQLYFNDFNMGGIYESDEIGVNLTLLDNAMLGPYIEYGISYNNYKVASRVIGGTTRLSQMNESTLIEETIHDFGSNNGRLDLLLNHQGNIYFYGGGTSGLWKSDYTSAGTQQVHSVNITGSWNNKNRMVVYNNKAYFVGNDGSGAYVWVTEGTNETTQKYNVPLLGGFGGEPGEIWMGEGGGGGEG